MTNRTILVTGATGKVGRVFISRLLSDPNFEDVQIRALVHNRELPPHERITNIHGSIEHQEVVNEAMQGITHVLHLATVKETPEQIMDVAVKGLFWLLEACRTSNTFQQFLMVGGDAGVGHFVYPHPQPVTEQQKHSAYPGCYALSKVLEEVMLEQYYIQYDLNGCCLRAPWIMEKDDFKYQLSFGDDVFGGPRWHEYVSEAQAKAYVQSHTVPVMLDADGFPVKRNFVHVEDLVSALLLAIDHPKARQQLFNICMNEPVDYGKMGIYLQEHKNLPIVKIKTEYHSTWLDNAKARLLLGWEPVYNMEKLIEEAWAYQREADEPRIIWYPG